MKVPRGLQNLIESFQKLPGIGPKSAQRLAYYLLHVPQYELDDFATALAELKTNTVLCSLCRNVSEKDPCPICADEGRDDSVVLVVEQPLDVLAFERTGKFGGLYHVLHGNIDPLNNIGPDELFIDDLFAKLRKSQNNGKCLKEIIIATNPTMEGEATAMYLNKKIVSINDETGSTVVVTRLGMGIPTGADVEYADEMTLTRAIEGRRKI